MIGCSTIEYNGCPATDSQISTYLPHRSTKGSDFSKFPVQVVRDIGACVNSLPDLLDMRSGPSKYQRAEFVPENVVGGGFPAYCYYMKYDLLFKTFLPDNYTPVRSDGKFKRCLQTFINDCGLLQSGCWVNDKNIMEKFKEDRNPVGRPRKADLPVSTTTTTATTRKVVPNHSALSPVNSLVQLENCNNNTKEKCGGGLHADAATTQLFPAAHKMVRTSRACTKSGTSQIVISAYLTETQGVSSGEKKTILPMTMSRLDYKKMVEDRSLVLRRNPADPLPFKLSRIEDVAGLSIWDREPDEEAGVSLEEQLRMPASVRDLCPELRDLYLMSVAHKPSLPFPLKRSSSDEQQGEQQQQPPIPIPEITPRTVRKQQKNLLMLSMVYSTYFKAGAAGQMSRDGMRLMALEGLESNLFNVRSFDHKHDTVRFKETDPHKHCCGIFSDGNKFTAALSNKWPGVTYDYLIMDYFFSPDGEYIRTRWGQFLPATGSKPCTLERVAIVRLLNKGAVVLLPNIQTVRDQLFVPSSHKFKLSKFFSFSFLSEKELHRHPLYVATEAVDEELQQLDTKSIVNNETQMEIIYCNADPKGCPFLELTIRDQWAADG